MLKRKSKFNVSYMKYIESFFNRFFFKIENVSSRSRIQIFKTLYANFRLLPISQAYRFPIIIYQGVCIRTLWGRVEIIGDIRSGMLKIGGTSPRSREIGCFTVNGVIRMEDNIRLSRGCNIEIGHGAILYLSHNLYIGENNQITCWHRICLCSHVSTSWNCEISDTDLHYCVDVASGTVSPCSKEVYIAPHSWIGNNCIVKKGTKTKEFSIFGSGSILTKDYSNQLELYPVYVGSPAKYIKSGVRRVVDDKEIDEYFKSQRTVPYIYDKNVDYDGICL